MQFFMDFAMPYLNCCYLCICKDNDDVVNVCLCSFHNQYISLIATCFQRLIHFTWRPDCMITTCAKEFLFS